MQELNLMNILDIIKKNFVGLVLAMIIGTVLSITYMHYLVPESFISQAHLIVNQQQGQQTSQLQYSEIQSNVFLIKTYEDIILGDATLNQVSESLGDRYSMEDLQDVVEVHQKEDSQAFYISATAASPEEAQTIVANIVDSFSATIDTLYSQSDTLVNVLSQASFNVEPVSPNMIVYGIMGTLLGVLIYGSVILYFVRSDTTIKDKNYFTEKGFISLGEVVEVEDLNHPKVEKGKGNKKNRRPQLQLISHIAPSSLAAEQFRTIRTNVDFARINKNTKTFLITSSIPGEGKSTIAANLAFVIGQTNKKVLIVDSDLRRPTVHRTFKLNNLIGLTSLLVDATMQLEEAVQKSLMSNLDILTSGPKPPNPAELLSSIQMDALINEVREMYDFVIFDTPPVTTVSDAQVLATKVDGVILVVRSAFVDKKATAEALEFLKNIEANVLGIIMNGKPIDKSKDRYNYYEEDDYDDSDED